MRVFPAFALVSVCATVLGCGAAPPKVEDSDGRAVCKARTTVPAPLTVAWPTELRTDLEARAKSGAVVVSYQGCEIKILSECHAKGTYRYFGVTPKEDQITIKSEDELYGNLAIGAMSLEAAFKKSGQFSLKSVAVGKWVNERSVHYVDELSGACAAATHVVTSLSIGAFELSSGSAEMARGGLSVAGVGGGGRTQREKAVVTSDGQPGTCSSATAQGAPATCSSILRIETAPLVTRPPRTPAEEVLLTSIKILMSSPVVLPVPNPLKEASAEYVARAFAVAGEPQNAYPFFRKYFSERAPVLMASLAKVYESEGRHADSIEVYSVLLREEGPRACEGRPAARGATDDAPFDKPYQKLLADYCDVCGCGSR